MNEEMRLNELKETLLNDFREDKKGETNLFKRAKKINASNDKRDELDLILSLSNQINEFESPEIARLFNYIRWVGLETNEIFDTYLNVLRNNPEINLYQKIQLVNYLFNINSERMPSEVIYDHLRGVKEEMPWVYADFLSRLADDKSFEKAVELIKYLNRTEYNSSYFLSLFSRWIETLDEKKIKKALVLLNSLPQDDKRYLEKKLKKVGISISQTLTDNPAFKDFVKAQKSKNLNSSLQIT